MLSPADRERVANIYLIGSRVYQTHRPDSDFDYLILLRGSGEIREIETPEMSLHLISEDRFQQALIDHEVEFVEALSHPLKEEIKLSFAIDKSKLRSSFSRKADHSYVKGKKKIIIEAQNSTLTEEEREAELLRGRKSLFHAFRILEFGIQLATFNQIDFNCADLWKEFASFDFSSGEESWKQWEAIFRPRFNQKKSQFRICCPK
jgi:predicted nucleotidyltransferase